MERYYDDNIKIYPNVEDNTVENSASSEVSDALGYSGSVLMKYKFRGVEVLSEHKNSGTIDLLKALSMALCGYTKIALSPNLIDIVDKNKNSILLKRIPITSKRYLNSSYRVGALNSNMVDAYSAVMTGSFTKDMIAISRDDVTANENSVTPFYDMLLMSNSTVLANVRISCNDIKYVMDGYQGIITWKMTFENKPKEEISTNG